MSGIRWYAAIRIAWRDLQASPGKFLLLAATIALSVASLGGLQGSISGFRSALSHNLREWIAADVSVQTNNPPDSQQSALLHTLEQQGISQTVVIDTMAQVTSPGSLDPQQVVAKVVDPAQYPFYGKVRLNPDLPLNHTLTADTVAVPAELLGRLRVKLGDTIEVSGVPLRISAIVQSEPDQLAVVPSPLARILLAHQAGERAGLLRPRGVYYQRFLFRLPNGGPGVEQTVHLLEQTFPGRKVLDYRRPDPQITTVLGAVGRFLQMVSLLALLASVLSLVTGLWAHLEQKLDSLAIMKMLGGRSRDLLLIYGLETLAIAATGSIVGAVGAFAVEHLAITAVPLSLGLSGHVEWQWRAPLQAAAVGLLLGVLIPLPVIAQVRHVRPYRILRRGMSEASTTRAPSWLQKIRLILLATMGTGAVLSVATGSWQIGALLTAVGLGGAGVLWLGSTAFLWAFRQITGRGQSIPLPLRYGIENLFRPGHQSRAVLSAMSAAVCLLFSVHLFQRAVVSQLEENLPPSSAFLALLNIEPEQRDQVRQFLTPMAAQPWIEPFFPVRILRIDSRSIIQKLNQDPNSIDTQRRWLATRLGPAVPPTVEITEGMWGPGPDHDAQVALPRSLARDLGAHIGSHIEFEVGETRFVARVVALDRLGLLDRVRCCVLFNQAVPAPATAIYHGVVSVAPTQASALRIALYHAFPAIVTVDAAEATKFLTDWLDAVLWIIRVAGFLSAGSAALFLAMAVGATRLWRIREIALLRAIGAGQRQVVAMYTVEFTLLGAMAACLGGATAWVLVAFGGKRLLESRELVPTSFVVTLLLLSTTVLLANLTGWLTSFRFLRRKPLEALREE